MTFRKKRFLQRLAAVAGFLLFAVIALGWDGSWGLGRYKLTIGRPSPPLQYSLASSGGLDSYGFVSGVGGVAFAGVAAPSPELAQQKIQLKYDGSRPDGARFQVQIGTASLQTDLADWMLAPIARFADSEFDSCVSLFGPKTTETEYDIVYHRDFQDTLLGLRLMQADILLFDLGETWHLPEFNGRVILGTGEAVPRKMDNQAATQIDHALSAATFQSWVLTDQGEQIIFENDRGRLRITGTPYYYFWTSDVETISQRQEALHKRALEALKAGNAAEHNRIVTQANRMTPQVQEVMILTSNLKAARDAIRRFNGPVYDAATRTMQYAAFFRYVRHEDARAWSDFIEQLRTVKVEPQITTPTRWAH